MVDREAEPAKPIGTVLDATGPDGTGAGNSTVATDVAVASGRPQSNGGRLALNRLGKQYPGFTAVDAIDLDVRAGEFLTLLGPSGSGKTTTLMMIAGFANPSRGDIRLDDASIVGMPPEKRNIGVVFQDYALFPHMSVFENIAFPLKMRRMHKRELEARVHWALDLVRLTGFERRAPRQLSGGQQQRIAFARALVFRPRILLMDEPLGALDKSLREQMQFELMRLHKQVGATIIYVTHDQKEALTMSDRIALMNHGRIEQIGTPQDLYERPSSRFVAEFIGESNIVPGNLKPGPTPDHMQFVSGAFKLLFPTSKIEARQGNATRFLVLRPEKLRISPPNSQSQNGAEIGTVEEATYVGDQTRYRARLGELVLTIVCNNVHAAYRPVVGETVVVSCDPQDAYLLAG